MAIFDSIRLGASGVSTGYEIERSLRFERGHGAYLSRTASSPTNVNKFSYSCWVKRTLLNQGSMVLMGGGGGSQTNTNAEALLYFVDSDEIASVYKGGLASCNIGWFMKASRKLRDPSAWMHLLSVWDGTLSGDSNRMKFYINGVQDPLGHDCGSTSNGFQYVNRSGSTQYIGRMDAGAGPYYASFYLTEAYFVDGTACVPSDFIETNSKTGVISPKDSTDVLSNLTMGNNGFYLNFSDNSNTTSSTLGKDYSGNNNNWTPYNFNVSSGTDNDSLEDTPTNNCCVINPIDTYRSGNTVSDGNLKLQRTGSNFGNARGSFAVNSGKWYYEWKCTGTGNQIGWVNTGFDINYNGGDVAVTSSGGNGVGMYWDSRTFMYGWQNSGGNDYFPNSANYASYTNGDIIMVAFDVDNFKFWFGKNGSWINVLGTANPSTGSDGITPVASKNNGTYVSGMYFTPLISCWSSGSGYVNFGQRPFTYTIPTGYKKLVSTDLPNPTILLPNKHFDTLLWTGDGNDNRAITGLDFAPDWVWLKVRSEVYNHSLNDTVRGINKQLSSNLTADETTYTDFIKSFNSNGFTLGVNYDVNRSGGRTYVGWNWNAGGTTVTNNDGSISSQVRASTITGFSIVLYTASGSNGSTVGHGLGVKPDVIITKRRNNTSNWGVYHSSIGANKSLFLNTTHAPIDNTTYYNDTEPTSTVFTLGGSNESNGANGDTYVAYCFSEVDGFSRFSKYKGNNNSNGTFVSTNFSVAWLMIKRIDSTRDWVIYDVKRGSVNTIKNFLESNTNNSEQTNTNNSVDFLSNGFKFRDTSGDMNGAGEYVFLAFAESPFKNARAR